MVITLVNNQPQIFILLIFADRTPLRIYLSIKQDWWDEKLPEGGVISCLSVIPKVLLAGAITLMDEAYYKLAVWLNDKGKCPQ